MSSYGEKYGVNFFDVDENKFRLQILEYGYGGDSSTNLTLAKNPITITYEQDDDYFQPIIGSTCKIDLIIEDKTLGDEWEDEPTNWELADFFWEYVDLNFLAPQSDREFKIKVHREIANGTTTSTSTISGLEDSSASFSSKVKVGDLVINNNTNTNTTVTAVTDNNTLVLASDIFTSGTTTGKSYTIFRNLWTGFIVQDSYTFPIANYPFQISVYASDLIGTLDGYTYDLTTNSPTAFASIQNCLKNINVQDAEGTAVKSLEFGYKVLCRLNYFTVSAGSYTSNDNPYTLTHINFVDAFKDENSNFLDCKTILISLLQMFNCRIFQHEGTWTIIDNASLSLSSFNDSGGSYSKEFKVYSKAGSLTGTEAIASPVVNINSSQSSSTIQPMNNDLLKTIKPPTIRQKNQIKIKHQLKKTITNGGFETTSSPSGSTPSYGNDVGTWTIVDKSITFGVDVEAVNTAVSPPVTFGKPAYQGSFSLLSIGSSSSTSTFVATNNTGNIGSTTEETILSFATRGFSPDLTSDPTGQTPLNNIGYTIKFQILLGGVHYWNNSTGEWTSSVTTNFITDSINDEWVRREVKMSVAPITGSVEIKLLVSQESTYGNSNFRMYYDDFTLQSSSDLEYLDTEVKIVKTEFKNNNAVLKSVENIFGTIQDAKYSNCLVDSSGNVIFQFKGFDEGVGLGNPLEVKMNQQRLNDFAKNNERYEGTFRKVKDSDNFTTPISMLTLPKISFDTFSLDNHCAIDNLQYNVSENRYSLRMHVPDQSNFTDTNLFNDIEVRRNFYEDKPKD